VNQSGQVRRPAINHASELAVALAPAHAAALCLANMSCWTPLPCAARTYVPLVGTTDWNAPLTDFIERGAVSGN
jgi:hypothetical protein